MAPARPLDLTTLPLGREVELAVTAPGPDQDLLAWAAYGLARALGVPGDPDTATPSRTADPPGPSGQRLRLAVTERDGDMMTVRLVAVGQTGQPSIEGTFEVRSEGRGRGAATALGLEPGARRVERFAVTSSLLTGHIEGGAPILATPSMITLMEQVAARLVSPRLPGNRATVGTWIGVAHRGAAYEGDILEVSATYVGSRGRRLIYDVAARVGEELVGDGQVGQHVIDRDHFGAGTGDGQMWIRPLQVDGGSDAPGAGS